jgi:sigma-E factor negative regulatory protein RseB
VTNRRVASYGPIVFLGPLALFSLLLLPGSAPTLRSPNLVAGDPAALRLLDRATAAPDAVSYRGTQFVSAWTEQGSTGLIVEVVHRAGQGTTVHTAGTATAPAARTYVAARTGAPSLLTGSSTLTLLGRHFDLATAAPGRVAGRVADVVVVSRPGGTTASARFWLDRETGLVLRREVYDERGRTTRASAFIDVSIARRDDDAAADIAGDDPAGDGTSGEAGTGEREMASPRAWPYPLSSAALHAMRRKGWACPDHLPPSLQLVDARRGGGEYGGIVHLSYSDGLATVSVFEQRGRLQSDHLDGYRASTVAGRPVYVRDGVPQRITWSGHGTVFTVVADASSRTVHDVVTALPHDDADGGALGRLGRGLDRVASWFNPFG